mmetsp:Transcript_7388/g.17635  ORF Transcript_7388/g.17635 Transcript_7388/m.17635 type:complete len:209 (-) Transcript_7388:345-971(-)
MSLHGVGEHGETMTTPTGAKSHKSSTTWISPETCICVPGAPTCAAMLKGESKEEEDQLSWLKRLVRISPSFVFTGRDSVERNARKLKSFLLTSFVDVCSICRRRRAFNCRQNTVPGAITSSTVISKALGGLADAEDGKSSMNPLPTCLIVAFSWNISKVPVGSSRDRMSPEKHACVTLKWMIKTVSRKSSLGGSCWKMVSPVSRTILW